MGANHDGNGKRYAQKAPVSAIDDAVVVLITNSTAWDGTTWTWNSGRAVAICAAHSEFKAMVQHEAGGHGFAKLADEYYADNTFIDEARRANLLARREYGFFLNVDLTNDPAQVLWKDFIGHPKYPMAGIFEGGLYCSSGVWRPEKESLMFNNIPYFNAPSRAAIVKRIRTLAGEPFDMEWFMETDIIEPYVPTKATMNLLSLPPLPPPVWVVD